MFGQGSCTHTRSVSGWLSTPEVWGSGRRVCPITAVETGLKRRSVWGESFDLKALWPSTLCRLLAPWHYNPLTSCFPTAQHMTWGSCVCVLSWLGLCVCISSFPKAGKVGSAWPLKCFFYFQSKRTWQSETEPLHTLEFRCVCCSWVMKYTCNTA